MHIIFLGAEDQTDRDLLLECGVEDIGVNFFDLGVQQQTALFDKTPDEVRIHLYAGNPPSQVLEDQVGGLAQMYEDYVEKHIDRLYSWSEVRHPAVRTAERQTEFYDRFDAFRFRPVYNETQSMFDLEGLADKYPHVLLTREAISIIREAMSHDNTEDPLLALSSEYGTVFHAMGMHRAKKSHYNFATVATAMWQAPRRFGQPVIWDGRKLTRSNADVSEDVLDKHYARIKAYGLDADAIIGGDRREGMKLAIISMLEYQKACERTPGLAASIPVETPETSSATPEVVSPLPEVSDSSDGQDDGTSTGNVISILGDSTQTTRNSGSGSQQDRKGHFPFLGTEMMSTVVPTDSGSVVEELPLVTSGGEGVRNCNICVLSRQCPAYEVDAECKFGMPVELRTRDQLMAVLRTAMEIQSSRVFFSRFQEELSGGSLDEQTSKEIDRLFKLATQLKSMDEVKESVSVTVERKSSAGVLSALFGKAATDSLMNNELPPAE